MLVQQGLAEDPFGGAVFAFRGRRAGLIKLIWHDGVGLCMLTKRLEHGQFVWPSATHDRADRAVLGATGGAARRMRVARAGAAPPAGTGRINSAVWSNKLWHRRGGIVHHCAVQIDPDTLPDDPALLQQMLRMLLRPAW